MCIYIYNSTHSCYLLTHAQGGWVEGFRTSICSSLSFKEGSKYWAMLGPTSFKFVLKENLKLLTNILSVPKLRRINCLWLQQLVCGGFLRQSEIIPTIRNSVLAPGAVKTGCLSFTREVVIRAAFRPERQHLRPRFGIPACNGECMRVCFRAKQKNHKEPEMQL